MKMKYQRAVARQSAFAGKVHVGYGLGRVRVRKRVRCQCRTESRNPVLGGL